MPEGRGGSKKPAHRQTAFPGMKSQSQRVTYGGDASSMKAAYTTLMALTPQRGLCPQCASASSSLFHSQLIQKDRVVLRSSYLRPQTHQHNTQNCNRDVRGKTYVGFQSCHTAMCPCTANSESRIILDGLKTWIKSL